MKDEPIAPGSFAGERAMRTLVAWLALLAVVTVVLGFLVGIISVGWAGQGFFTAITLAHFPAVVGLPASKRSRSCTRAPFGSCRRRRPIHYSPDEPRRIPSSGGFTRR
jgi:hypothetical protein